LNSEPLTVSYYRRVTYMKIVLIAWEECPEKITYTVGFLGRETKKDLYLATEYDPATGEYRDIISIPVKSIRTRRIFNPKNK